MNRLLPAISVLACLSACSAPLPPERQTAASKTAAACRSRADEIFLKQNRALLSERTQRDNPFASTGSPGITTEGLGQQYGRDVMIADCIRSTGAASANGPGITPGGAGTSPAMDPNAGMPDTALPQ
jgi:hypothetical protein